MNAKHSIHLIIVALTVWSWTAPALAQQPPDRAAGAEAADPFAVGGPVKEPSWKAPAAEDVRQQLTAWIAAHGISAERQATIDALWQTPVALETAAAELLERVAQTAALVDDRAAALLVTCSGPRDEIVLPTAEWLHGADVPPVVRHNLALYYARWLAQELLYDESYEQLVALQPGDVVDPAAALFYQGVVYHRALLKKPGLEAVTHLLEDVANVPPRYRSLGGLMLMDLKALEEESLDHISRRMDDIRRRLDLGRAGPRVRGQQDGVIASLDKLIEKLEEEEKKKNGGGGSGPPRGIQSSSPAPDSQPAQGKGPGDVAPKRLATKGGWGDLPPKERQEALQQIAKGYPSHYREVIEQYFRKLASEEEEPNNKKPGEIDPNK